MYVYVKCCNKNKYIFTHTQVCLVSCKHMSSWIRDLSKCTLF